MKKIMELFNLYVLKNSNLIYFLLQSIKDCIPKEHREKYAIQIDCISNIQWVLKVEVNFYLDKDTSCKKSIISKWDNEQKIAKANIVDMDGKKYTLNFFVVGGRIFSIESNLPFRYLRVSQIKDLQIKCVNGSI